MKTSDILDEINKEESLLTYQGEDRVEPLATVLKKYYSDNPAKKQYLSKIDLLDTTIDGFYQGQLVVISGRTGQGKTTLCQTITRSLMEQVAYPMWFTYEVPVNDFANSFTPDYHDFIYLPIKLTSNKLKWIEDRIKESQIKYQTKAVFIDHLHYLVEMNPMANYSYVIGEKVRALKQLAIQYNIIVFLVAHMMKTQEDQEPSLGDIRDSSFIEQEADTVLYVWRWKEDMRVTIVKVAKNRKKGIVDKKIGLVLKDGRYYEKENQRLSEGEQGTGTSNPKKKTR